MAVRLLVACDVQTLFADAAPVFGPQKGADEATVALLEARVRAWADELEAATRRVVRSRPGAGAAGGLGAGGYERVVVLDETGAVQKVGVVLTEGSGPRPGFGQELQRDGLPQREILRPVHLAHATFAEQADDSITLCQHRSRREAGLVDGVR